MKMTFERLDTPEIKRIERVKSNLRATKPRSARRVELVRVLRDLMTKQLRREIRRSCGNRA